MAAPAGYQCLKLFIASLPRDYGATPKAAYAPPPVAHNKTTLLRSVAEYANASILVEVDSHTELLGSKPSNSPHSLIYPTELFANDTLLPILLVADFRLRD